MDAARQSRGMEIAATIKISKNQLGHKVPSQSGNGSYVVNVETPFCSCPDFETRAQPCKHIYAVQFTIQREEGPNGTSVETVCRVTYSQNWSAYNAAQVNEQEQFGLLLRDLCNTIPQPPQTMGRPRLSLGDMVLAAGTKVYSTLSARRAMTNVRNADLERTPHFNSVLGYLNKGEMTPLIKELIELSALPLQAIERDFAVDGSGFSTSTYARSRWYDEKYGKTKRRTARWLKAHIMTGVTTNIVTAAEVTPDASADSPFLPVLVNTTSQGFDVKEVSADKAYLSRTNLHAIEDVGATPFIPFKADSVPRPRSGYNRDALWERAYHFYHLHRSEFLAHYHKRSNVETTFAMIKAKFGDSVRAKNPVAQVNEVLVKILCHNICVLIQSMYEFGVAKPVFNR